MYTGWSGLLQSVVLSEWRGPPSTPAPRLSSEPRELSFFSMMMIITIMFLYDDHHIHMNMAPL